ncbi:site-2 protease family protein [Candidatus Peregrinibacteria bacterium]|nr:site-2 protease family protein [Candidatus Peregrinibacteria bacterium]
MFFDFTNPLAFFIYFFALVFAITIHEFSHAWMANYLGDPTAKYEGRVSLNPFVHLDLIGTLMLFLVGIGWGKPVPVNPANFHHSKRDQAKVAFAGPFSNLITAFFISIPYKYLPQTMEGSIFFLFMANLFEVSILLFIFNMFPFPPLDGSKFIGLIIPKRWHYLYDRFLDEGMKYFVFFLFIDVFILGRYFNYSILNKVIWDLYEYISAIILLGT